MKIKIGGQEIEFSQDQYNSMIWNYYKDEQTVTNNTKYKIEYIVSTYIDDPNNSNCYSFKNGTINETYNSLLDAMIRIYNLKILNVYSADISVHVKNGQGKNIIIDDSIDIDFFDKCLNSDSELRKLYIQIEALEQENKLYKEFIIKYKCEKLLEDFKKEKKYL
jgi:hypothetical protein